MTKVVDTTNIKAQRKRLGAAAQKLDFLLLAKGYGIEIERLVPAGCWKAIISTPLGYFGSWWGVWGDSLQELFERAIQRLIELPIIETFPDEGSPADVEEPETADPPCHWCQQPKSVHGTDGRCPDEGCEWDMQTMHFLSESNFDALYGEEVAS
jgi:hypothetical protein